MGVLMQLARKVALEFGLRESEKNVFKEAWKLHKRSEKPRSFREALAASAEVAVEQAFVHLVNYVTQTATPAYAPPDPGHQYAARRPTSNNYVIFSDFHRAYEGHRHNFFTTSRNHQLYADVLDEYFNAGYTLVENGDVEELVIFEPTLQEMRDRVDMTWAQMAARRLERRRAQFQAILDDEDSRLVYERVASFHNAFRYIKIAGNHDYDLQRDEFLALLATQFPGIPRPFDYLLLRTGTTVDWVIMHGHQFDKATNRVVAPQLGEIISESLAWAYQGADRVWRWNDQVNEWALGQRQFFNLLVSDAYDLNYGADDFIGDLIGGNLPQGAWESIFKHKIAWEYFENPNPQDAILEEVITGDEFFKYRHLNEIRIAQRVAADFTAENRPKLVLGHTHEARYQPHWDIDHGWVSFYFNTGSAGRFENLLWGLEIADGVPILVGWTRRGGPLSADTPERHVFSLDGLHKYLQASAQAIPLG